MPDTLASSRNAQFPPCFCRTHDGKLIITDGINPGKIWGGVATSLDALGITAPAAAPTVATPVGGAATAGDYDIAFRYKTADGEYSSISPIRTVTAVANDQFSYSDLTASSDSRVTKIQVLRTVADDELIYYLDIEIDNGTTTGSSTKSDDTLADLDNAYPLTNGDGTENLTRQGIPETKAFFKAANDRYLSYGDVDYDIGHVEVTNGSASVQGRGTQWTSEMALDDIVNSVRVGRRMYFNGHTTEYTISSINTTTQVITLTANYGGSTSLFQGYTIRRNKLERAKIRYSPVAEPMSQRPLDSLLPIEEVVGYTGGFTIRGSHYVCEARRLWQVYPAAMQGRSSANNKPGLGMKHVASRGCVNDRSWVLMEDLCFLLDHEGCWVTDGNGAEPISAPIQDYWANGRINFEASKWFFASFDPAAELIRWHVSLGDAYFPTTCLAYNYRRKQWQGTEEYVWGFGSSVMAEIGGAMRPLYGGPYGKFYTRQGTLDGCTERTIRGGVTAASLLTLTDASSDAVIPTASVVGTPLAIVAGRGKGQVRRITAYSAGVFEVWPPWDTVPSATTDPSTYQVGGIPWSFKTGVMEFPPLDSTRTTRQYVVVTEPTVNEASLDIRTYLDHAATPENYVAYEDDGLGVTTEKDKPDATLTLKRVRSRTALFSGRGYKRLDGLTMGRNNEGRYIQTELRGMQGMDAIKVYEVTLEGVAAE